MRKFSKPWDFVADFQAEERHLTRKSMLFHFQAKKISDKFTLKASRAVVFDHFNHAMLDFFVLENYLLEIICVQPFHPRFRNWLMWYVNLIDSFGVIHKFINDFSYFVSGILYFKNVTIELFNICTFRVLNWHSLAWVDYVNMRKFKWQLLHIDKFSSFLLIITKIDLKYPIIIPEHALKRRDNIWHNLLSARQQQKRFGILRCIFVLAFEFFHVGIQSLFNVIRTFESLLKEVLNCGSLSH